MPNFKDAHATLPASDLDRAKNWYADKLGLKPSEEGDVGAYYDVGSSRFLLYPSQFAGTNQATAASFEVDDIEAAVAELRQNGVTFEEYDIPGVKTENGIATFEAMGRTVQSAWFKDSEGNILAIGTG